MKLSFDKIAYNIEGIPETEKVIEHFTDLMSQAHVFDDADIPEGVDNDKVLRYLIYMFSPGTPVREAFPHIDRRKKYVLNKLNLLDQHEGYGEMCLMNRPWIIQRFITFTRLQRSEDYAILATAEVMIHKIQEDLLKVESSKSTDFSNYQKGLESWREALVSARERIMSDEKSIALQRAVTFSVKADTLGISPEEYAKSFRENGIVFPEVIP